VVCYMAPGSATRTALTHPTQTCLQRPNDRVARLAPLLQLVVPQQLEQIPERPALNDQRAVPIKLAEIEVRMQRELQRGERALEAYGDIRTRLCGPCLISCLRVFPNRGDGDNGRTLRTGDMAGFMVRSPGV
jgi:hypothetical protein